MALTHTLMPNGQPWTTLEERDAIIQNTPTYRLLHSDPRYLEAIASKKATRFSIDVPERGTVYFSVDANGNVTESNHSKKSSLFADGLALIPGVTGVLSNLGSGANAAADAANSGGNAADTAYIGQDVAKVASSGSQVAHTAAETAAAAAPSVWRKVAPYLIAGGAQAYASYKQSQAAKTASQQMVDASNRALDFSKGIYADQKANQAPFIGVGQGAISGLGQMLRIPQNSPQAMTTPAQGPLTALSQGQNPSTVMMRAPDGSTRAVSASQVPMLQARGATVVQS